MLIRALAALSLSLTLAACSTNPATGRTQFNALSREQEISIGEESTPELIQEFGGEVPNSRVQAYVDEVGRRLVPYVEEEFRDLPWEFTMVNSGVINAFALPGGKVFISRGMAEAMENEAMLAGVLGHEMGHVTARHVNDRFSQQMGIGLGASVIGAVLGDGGTSGQLIGAASEAAGSLVLLSFSREQEIESDYLGMRYMTRAGYSPEGMLQMMQVLLSESQGGGGLEFFSTHPNPDTRIDEINEHLAGEFSHTRNNPQFILNSERYRSEMLAPLSQLPPPPDARQGHAPAHRTPLMGRIALNDPTTWCAHCAAAAAH